MDRSAFNIRTASKSDVEALTKLIRQLGFSLTADVVAENIETLAARGLPPLVAESDSVIGCLTYNVMHVLHRPTPVGRISMLIVADPWRGKGAGRALVSAGMEQLRHGGCGLCEVTSNSSLRAAHAFYEKLGFERTSIRFARSL